MIGLCIYGSACKQSKVFIKEIYCELIFHLMDFRPTAVSHVQFCLQGIIALNSKIGCLCL